MYFAKSLDKSCITLCYSHNTIVLVILNQYQVCMECFKSHLGIVEIEALKQRPKVLGSFHTILQHINPSRSSFLTKHDSRVTKKLIMYD